MIDYGYTDSPFGRAFVAECEGKICAIYFGEGDHLAELKRHWSMVDFREKEIVFNPRAELMLKGTPFQISVWNALREIPAGMTLTYSDLAASMGIPRATRAVASAVARNEISLLVPCHRIVPKSGGVGNYRWGSPLKRAMLEAEGVIPRTVHRN